MNSSMNDQIKGTFHEVKGKVKEVVGRATNRPGLRAAGKVENLGGVIQRKVGRIKKVFGK